ncbi:TBC1 domain family member 5 homolog A-like isoform X3 [Mercenaria mercenaria]|uniref:TBC1 domain family member 5 homolog A-like isoform X3 n=1 Tax=Mercenaria mercenaria TaxID=6596 RepID=UPI00234EEAE9|nr:TBC1 domain family member 5 homolog A-like isoform X3 [Mercenaria mercenaria]
MADAAENDTIKNKEEKTTLNKEKVKKDEENEKLKTGTQESTNTHNKLPDDVASQDASKNENTNNSAQNKDINAENSDTVTANNDAKAENVNNTDADKEKTRGDNKSKQDNKTDRKTGQKSVENGPVNVKLVQGHYKTHTKSTLPHVLAEYGLEDKDHPKKEKRKKRKKKVEVASDNEDDEKSKRKARDEIFRHVFSSTRETDNYYSEYIDFLEQKVIQQRQKAQRDLEEAERLRALKLEKESEEEVKKVPEAPPLEPEYVRESKSMKQKRRYVRKLERVELKHDDSFLRDIPKTDTARIIALQDKLKKEGKLKTQCDVDKFWNDIRKPHVFYEHFKVHKKDAGPFEPSHENDSHSDSQEEQEGQPGPEMAPRSLSHISEASRDREPWAITQKFQTSHGPKTPIPERKRRDSIQMAKDAAVDLEKRCPKLEMPPLACFSLKLGKKPPDPEEITKNLDIKAREKSRKKFQRKLNKMYQMAMTNTAAANRILAQHGNITNILEGAALRDLRNFCCEPREISHISELAVFDEPYPTLEDYYRDITDPSRALEVHPDVDRQSIGSRSQPSTRQSSAASRKLTPISDTSSRAGSKTRKKKKSPEMIEFPVPLPLSFDEVTTKEKTMEPKCVSTLWTNYMHAGKSVFSQ